MRRIFPLPLNFLRACVTLTLFGRVRVEKEFEWPRFVAVLLFVFVCFCLKYGTKMGWRFGNSGIVYNKYWFSDEFSGEIRWGNLITGITVTPPPKWKSGWSQIAAAFAFFLERILMKILMQIFTFENFWKILKEVWDFWWVPLKQIH